MVHTQDQKTSFMVTKKLTLKVYLDRVGERNGDSKWKAFRNRHHQYRHTNDEEFDKVLNIDGSTFWHPLPLLKHKVIDSKVEHQNDDCNGRHHQT